MREFQLQLIADNQRPIVNMRDTNISAMLDTGSIFPVWIADEKLLVNYMHATLIKERVPFGGFGGEAIGNLYRIPMLNLGDLEYPNIYMIAHRMNLPFHMIISATMLNRLRYEVDDENHVLTITIPEGQSHIRKLTITDSQGKLHVLCVDGEPEKAAED